MTEDEIYNYANLLVEFTILKHEYKLLENESVNTYLNRHIEPSINNNDYYNIIITFNKILAQKGYTISSNINKFDISHDK